APGRLPGALDALTLEHEDGDLARRALLIVRVRRVGGHGALPPGGSLEALDQTGAHVPDLGAVPQLDLGVVLEVGHPRRVRRRSTLGPDRSVDALVLTPHYRRLAELPPSAPP